MSRKKVSTTIYITSEQAERLKLLHERTKVPIAVYIREGIDLMLKHYEHMLPGQMSLEAAALSPAPPPVAPVASRRGFVGEPSRGSPNPSGGAAAEAGHDGSPEPPPAADSSKPIR